MHSPLVILILWFRGEDFPTNQTLLRLGDMHVLDVSTQPLDSFIAERTNSFASSKTTQVLHAIIQVDVWKTVNIYT
jgi:hypothetical protein